MDISFITYLLLCREREREFSKKNTSQANMGGADTKDGSFYACALIARKIFTLMQNEKKYIFFENSNVFEDKL